MAKDELNMKEFKLWLEFEEVDWNSWDRENNFANIQIEILDGRQYGLNIWTYKFFEIAIAQDKQFNVSLNGLYMKPPDLFVKELTRDCIHRTIADLLKQGDLEDVLNPSILISKQSI